MRWLAALGARLGLALLAATLALSGTVRLVSANLAVAEPPVSPPPQPDISEEMTLLLREITARDADLSRREARIALREQDLRVAREEIARNLDALAEAEAALEARMFASDGASEADLERLTDIYQGMKPKDAAALFEAMDPDFAAGFLARMSPDAAAAVFSNLPPLAAYAVSARIAGRNASAATESAE